MQEYEPNDEFISLLIDKEGIQGVPESVLRVFWMGKGIDLSVSL